MSCSLQGMKHVKKNFPKNSFKGTIRLNSLYHNNKTFYSTSTPSNISKKLTVKNNKNPQSIPSAQVRQYSTGGFDKQLKGSLNLDIDQRWKHTILEKFYELKTKYSMTDIKKQLNLHNPPLREYTDEYFKALEEKFIRESTIKLSRLKKAISESIKDEEARNACLVYLTKMHLYHTKEIIKNINAVWTAVKQKKEHREEKEIYKKEREPEQKESQQSNNDAPKELASSLLSRLLSKIKELFTLGSQASELVEKNSAEKDLNASE